MKLTKNTIALLIGSSMTAITGQASAHWSSGPFLYNDAGTNPMHLAPINLPSNILSTVSIDGTAALSAPTPGTLADGITGTSFGTYTQTRSTGSAYGWSAGQNPDTWGNSHDNKGLAFSLAQTSRVTFQIDTLGAGLFSVLQTGATTATDLSGNDWTPAFALFKGLATQSSHEGGNGNDTLDASQPGYAWWSPYATQNPYSATSNALYTTTTGNTYSGTEGTWGAYRSNADWTAGRDISATAEFGDGVRIGTDQTLGGENTRVLDYIASESAALGTHSLTSITYTLEAGDYSIWVGGNDPVLAAEQIQNYKDLYDAHQNNDAIVATEQAAFISSASASILAALTTNNTAQASHTLTLADKAAAQAVFDAALALEPQSVQDAYNAWQTAAAPIAALDHAIAELRLGHAFNIQTTVAAVPVPSAVWLFGSAIAGLVGMGGRRKKAQDA